MLGALNTQYILSVCPDYCGPGGDAEEGERAGGGPEETGSDPAAAVQVPAQRTTRGQQLIIQTHCHCCTCLKQCEKHMCVGVQICVRLNGRLGQACGLQRLQICCD